MRNLVLAAALLAGCVAAAAPDCKPIASACVGLAFATLSTGTTPPAPTPLAKCCGTCGKNGLPAGKVLSGDKLRIVPCGPTTCGCPDNCACKKSATCATGTCR